MSQRHERSRCSRNDECEGDDVPAGIRLNRKMVDLLEPERREDGDETDQRREACERMVVHADVGRDDSEQEGRQNAQIGAACACQFARGDDADQEGHERSRARYPERQN